MDELEPRWMVVANLVRRRWVSPGGDVRSGTKHFKPGAKLRLVGDYAGMCQDVWAVGHSRGGRLIAVVLRVWVLTNFRARVEYSPSVLRRVQEFEAEHSRVPYADESGATDRIRTYEDWIRHEKERRADAGLPWWVVEA